MTAKIFDGRLVSEDLLVSVRERVLALPRAPKLVSFYKPDDPGSKLYTQIKKQKAETAGIEFQDVEIFSADETVTLIEQASKDEKVTGILVQHPTGEFAFSDESWKEMVAAISQEKDVDGLQEDSPFIPATVKAILVALSFAKVVLPESKVAVVGATGMVGKPLIRVLQEKGAKVKEIDIETEDMWYQTKNADIVISCAGKHNLIVGDQIKEGAVVIDVGSPGGDVEFESVRAVASFLTPVPRGIGPLTVACLLENVVMAAEKTES